MHPLNSVRSLYLRACLLDMPLNSFSAVHGGFKVMVQNR